MLGKATSGVNRSQSPWTLWHLAGQRGSSHRVCCPLPGHNKVWTCCRARRFPPTTSSLKHLNSKEPKALNPELERGVCLETSQGHSQSQFERRRSHNHRGPNSPIQTRPYPYVIQRLFPLYLRSLSLNIRSRLTIIPVDVAAFQWQGNDAGLR